MSASDDDDITLAAKAMAQAALAAFVLFLVVLICQLAAPTTRPAQNAASSRNEQTFAALSARHGRDAARQVVYERDGRRFYYPTAQSGEEEIP